MERRVVWLYGNHDEDFRMSDPGRIEFRKHLALSNRLMIVHGDDFDEVMPKSLWFIRLFKLEPRPIRLRLGAPPVHVAALAKKWTPFLYRVLTEEVRMNAVKCAIEGRFEAITCGHVHYAEDSICSGRPLHQHRGLDRVTFSLLARDAHPDCSEASLKNISVFVLPRNGTNGRRY